MPRGPKAETLHREAEAARKRAKTMHDRWSKRALVTTELAVAAFYARAAADKLHKAATALDIAADKQEEA